MYRHTLGLCICDGKVRLDTCPGIPTYTLGYTNLSWYCSLGYSSY
uniref:Uncharacterized protein n=1 Tax=Arundo donax TaxID=35708 RepID=A0A0A8YCK2_ARUDO